MLLLLLTTSVLLVVAFVSLAYVRLTLRRRRAAAAAARGELPHGPPIESTWFGAAPVLRRRPRAQLAQTLAELAREYPGVCRLDLGVVGEMWLLSEPRLVNECLSRVEFDAAPSTVSSFSTLLGPNSLIALRGETWQRHRRLMLQATQPSSAHAAVIAENARTFARCVDDDAATRRGDAVNLQPKIMAMTLDNIARIGFGYNMHAQTQPGQELVRATRVVLDAYGEIAVSPLPPWLQSLLHPRRAWQLRGARRTFSTWVNTLVRQVHETKKKREQGDDDGAAGDAATAADVDVDRFRTMVERLLSPNERGETLTFDEARDEITTALFGGFETMTSTLSFACKHAAEHPELQARMAAEIDAALVEHTCGDDVSALSWDAVRKLDYTYAFLRESIRTEPIAPGFRRALWHDDQVLRYVDSKSGKEHVYTLPAHAEALIAGDYMMHEFEERGEEFWPDRFLRDDRRSLPSSSSSSSSGLSPSSIDYGFGRGLRMCPGRAFALMELRMLLVNIFGRYRLRLDPEHPPVKTTGFGSTLNPLPMLVERRRAEPKVDDK